MKVASVILAAGRGTRMKSSVPKVLHSLLGLPMIEWAVHTAATVSSGPPVVVVGHGRKEVQQLLGDRARYAVQENQLGTGHAVLSAKDIVGSADTVIVTYGDMPLLQPETLQSLLALYAEAKLLNNVALALLTVEREDPQGFGRILRDERGHVVAVVEEVDCTPEQLSIRELNPGVYCFDANWLWEHLPRIPKSAKGEYYLTDMVAIGAQCGPTIPTTLAPPDDVNGINTRVHLTDATAILRRRVLQKHMLNGVTIVDPGSTTIEATVSIGRDTTILPGTILRGRTTIGETTSIGPHCQIVDSNIGSNCRITFSLIEGATVEQECEIGPFGHLRRGTHVDESVMVGDVNSRRGLH